MKLFTHRTACTAWWSALEIIAALCSAQFIVKNVLARLLAPMDFGLISTLTLLRVLIAPMSTIPYTYIHSSLLFPDAIGAR